MIYIPNLLTLARFGLVPLFVVLLQSHQFQLSLLVFLVAGVTDGLDGFIAKRFNAQTRLGALLDPLADKALLVSAYIMLSYLSLIPFWLMVVVVFRDIVIVGGYLVMVLFFGSAKVEPINISKANTFFQIAFILAVLFSLSWAIDLSFIIQLLSFVVLLTSVISGLSYVWIGSVQAMQDSDSA